MININCTIHNCIFEKDGKCTLTHVSTPSNVYNPECIYFRPKYESNLELENNAQKNDINNL
ncbi:hypothetical protein SAMN02194393_05498 [Maledivibacter halophilus]|uniref:DUF1540 domain-containing protein n=1 Tax=Maledivibacter halophilus TaxID=36842 RepID=A0A1T5MXB3_9FIRM|nr:hypothetical protein SAMN02194393_05498 [Maledivibacter halophilus]